MRVALEPAGPASRRGRADPDGFARLERPLLLSGLALVALHFLDMALAGPDTTVPGVIAIVLLAVVWAVAQPRVTRPTRAVLAIAFGLLFSGFGVVSHVLHVVTSGPDAPDLTGVAFAVGGLLLVASGTAAIAAPGPPGERRGIPARGLHAAGWLAGAAVLAFVVFLPVAFAVMATHAPRWPISEGKLGIPHESVRVTTADGVDLAAWYVPSSNRAAVIVAHGSGGSRARVTRHIRMLARHGYGVLAVDLAGNGESDGRSNGLGDNAQPAMAAAVRYLRRRPDVDPERIGGFGLSLGGEVLLEAAARDPRLRAVVSDGAARPQDSTDAIDAAPAERLATTLTLEAVRGLSGMRTAPSLIGLVPGIAPRPVLLIAGGAVRPEVLTNRDYRAVGGATVQLWTVPGAGHTGGLSHRPAEYERRTTEFLDESLR